MRSAARRLLQFSRTVSTTVFLILGCCPLAAAQSQVMWSLVGPNAVHDRVVALAADPYGSEIYLAAPGGGVWQTVDAGQDWTALTDSSISVQVCSLATDPSTPGSLYLGTGDSLNPRPNQGVAHSTNHGQTWTFLPRFTNAPVCALTVDPGNPARLLAGSTQGLFLSTNSGSTWTQVLNSPVTSVSISGGILYAGILGQDTPMLRDKNLAYSTDGGNTWGMLSLPPSPTAPEAAVTWVSVSASSGSLTIALAYVNSASTSTPPSSLLDFYQSTNGGNTWTDAFAIAGANPPVQTFTNPVNGNIYMTGTNLLVSSNQGASWQTILFSDTNFHAVTISNGLLMLGGEQGVDALSLVQGVSTSTVRQLPIARFLGTTFDAQGGTWGAGPVGLIPIVNVTNVVLDAPVAGLGGTGDVVAPASGSTNVLASGNTNAYLSTNGGQQFSTTAVIPTAELHAPYPPLVLSSVTSTSAYMAGQHLYHTTDGGSTWAATASSTIDPDVTRVATALALAPSSSLTMYAATTCLPGITVSTCAAQTSNIWRSTNGGTSWTQLSSVDGPVDGLAVDPRQSTTVYAAVGGFPGGPSLTAGYIAGDLLCLGLCAGQTTSSAVWTSIRSNLPATPINGVIVDPTSIPTSLTQPAQKLYVATDLGVFVTFDAGAQWIDLTTGPSPATSIPATPVTHLYLRSSDLSLLASTFGRGVFNTATAGLSAAVSANPLSISVSLIQGATATMGIALSNPSSATTTGWFLNPLDPWITVGTSSGTLAASGTAEAVVHISAASLQTGLYEGRLQLVSNGLTQTIRISATVTAPPANLVAIAGNNVSAGTGATLSLEVMVTDSKQDPLAGIPVTFAVSGGGGSLSAGIATTNSSGVASTALTLPQSPGVVKVLATVGTLSATFTVTATPKPSLNSNSVLDAVTLNPYTSLGPGSVIAISGQNLATGTASYSGSTLPTTLQTTSVLISASSGNMSLQLFSVSPTLIEALLPTTLQTGEYSLSVAVGGAASNSVQISVAAYDPGIFTENNTGNGPGVFLQQNGSQISTTNPAVPGSTISFYASGLGAVTSKNLTVKTPEVYFDIYSATVVSSGLASNIPGRYLVTVRVPAQLSPADNISVSLTIGGFSSNRVTIPVQ